MNTNDNGSNGSNGHSNGQVAWIEIRDASNRLLFKYNPVRNEIEIKPRDSDVYIMIRLDEIRIKHGFTPTDMSLVFVREYVVTEITAERSKVPFSKSAK